MLDVVGGVDTTWHLCWDPKESGQAVLTIQMI